MGLLLRLILLVTLLPRLLFELFLAYIWRPQDSTPKATPKPDSESNGNSHNGHDDAAQEKEKLAKLDDRMEYWWGQNPSAPVRLRRRLKGLRGMNKVRLPLIIEAYHKQVLNRDNLDPKSIEPATSLLGAKVCVVGCGGGYLSEALVQMGADVVGIDSDEYDILTAKTHWKEAHGHQTSRPDYYHSSVKDFSEIRYEEFDIVVCSEQLQYRTDSLDLVPYICKLVKEGGVVMFTTNNRSISALCFIIGWMEHVAGTMPAFTHRFFKFVKPEELNGVVSRCGFQTVNVAGYLPLGLTLSLQWRMQWLLTSFIGVWYALVAKRLPADA